ncbi:hypothetical protein GMI69_07415 [Eggerthellaceae bacterium zg-887]|uniref:hypothetical protein n=1 Tax=Xiamenia xianingshaonis TaxID=2682776 RepID=UPI0013ED471F|nr:hypothetical protein [Xiamenia xianingshaonis]NGM18134.1 hypothetical protein [Eggerthellaceae bacterium zg-893]NHM16483.1 hypothetical protein [Xiamenia xianingshaonis]
MAKYGSYRGGYSRSTSRSGGFTNARTGRYVSSARAHQHVGQSFGGVTKARSSGGNYYMRSK